MGRARLTAVALATAVLAGACGGDGDGGDRGGGAVAAAGDEAAQLQVAAQGLCRSLALVEEGATEEAGRVFMDRSHDLIHQLAAKGLDPVPSETARVLENKQTVESAFRDPSQPSPELPQALFELHASLSDLAVELGHQRPEPCPGTAA